MCKIGRGKKNERKGRRGEKIRKEGTEGAKGRQLAGNPKCPGQ